MSAGSDSVKVDYCGQVKLVLKTIAFEQLCYRAVNKGQ